VSKIFSYHFPTEIIFGAGASKKIIEQLSKNSYEKILFVSDPNVSSFDFFKDIFSTISNRYESLLFSSFSPNPLSSEIDDVKNVVGGFVPDLILSIGGGASMDVAKALSVVFHHNGGILDYDEANGGDLLIDASKLVPVWAVPTTSGTGSEVGRCAVISELKTKQKKIIFHADLIPSLVICDPVLTEKLPAKITAQTGIDAFVHLFEAYCAPGYHPMADGIALEGMRLIEKSFIRAVNAPDLEARTNMMAAALMGAVAFQKGLGNIHSCAHSLSACFDIHHGLANGVMLPYGAQLNLSELGEKSHVISQVLGSTSSTGAELPHLLIDLVTESGLPTNLGAFGITDKDCDQLVQYAWEDGCHLTNARKMNEDLFRKLFISAM
jgi:alcohol dehydrogenase class IV